MNDEITQLFEPTIVEMFPECIIDIEVFVCQDLETIDIEHFDYEMAIERFSTYIWNEEAEQHTPSNTGE